MNASRRPCLRHQMIVVIVVIVVLSAGLLVACGSDDDAAAPAPAADVDAAAELLEPVAFAEYVEEHPDVPVVNVHVPYEGHIDGTDAFVDFEQILAWEDLPDDTAAPIALYCRSGNMSGIAARTLFDAGYTNIVDLAGGMNAWTDAGYELLDEDPEA